MVAVFGVLAILVLEFKTFKSTLIVASVLPLGETTQSFEQYITQLSGTTGMPPPPEETTRKPWASSAVGRAACT